MSNNEFVKIVNSLSSTGTTEIVKPKEVWNIDERCFRRYSDLIGDYKEFSEMDPDIPAKAKWEITEAFEIFLEFQKEMKEKIVKHNKQNTRKALLSILGLIISINSLIYTKLHSESVLKMTELFFIFAFIFCSFFFVTCFYKFISRKKDIGIVEKFLEETKIQEKSFMLGKDIFSFKVILKAT